LARKEVESQLELAEQAKAEAASKVDESRQEIDHTTKELSLVGEERDAAVQRNGELEAKLKSEQNDKQRLQRQVDEYQGELQRLTDQLSEQLQEDAAVSKEMQR